MVSGNQIRLNRILRKGKMLCIPMDHGISNGPIEGLEDPASTIYKCEGHGLTSVIINKGIIKTMPKPTRVGVLVHFSSSTSLSMSPNRKMLTGTVKEAVALGADGVSLHMWRVDHDYASTYDLEIIEGRYFDKEFPSAVLSC